MIDLMKGLKKHSKKTLLGLLKYCLAKVEAFDLADEKTSSSQSKDIFELMDLENDNFKKASQMLEEIDLTQKNSKGLMPIEYAISNNFCKDPFPFLSYYVMCCPEFLKRVFAAYKERSIQLDMPNLLYLAINGNQTNDNFKTILGNCTKADVLSCLTTTNAIERLVYWGRPHDMELFTQHGLDLEMTLDPTGKNAVHLICIKGKHEMIQYLVWNGIKIHEEDAYGITPSDFTLSKDNSNEEKIVV